MEKQNQPHEVYRRAAARPNPPGPNPPRRKPPQGGSRRRAIALAAVCVLAVVLAQSGPDRTRRA